MLVALHLAAVLGVAGALLYSGIAKLRDLTGSVAAIKGFDIVPDAWARPLGRLVPLGEVALGALLVLAWGRTHTIVAWLAVALLAGFALLVGVSLARGVRPACHCFGEVSAEPISERTLVRNLLLVAVAIFVALAQAPWRGLMATLRDSSATQNALALVIVAAAGGITWLMVDRSNGRRRIAELEQQVADLEARPVGKVVPDIPDTAVITPSGVEARLPGLVTDGRAKLVVGVSPTCSACKDLVPMIAGWRQILADELDVLLVSSGQLPEAVAAYPDHAEHLYADPHGAVLHNLRISGTPGAVLLGANGKVSAGPALGMESIVELITAIIQAIGVNVMTGVAHQAQGPRQVGGEDTGDAHLPETGTRIEDFLVRLEDGSEQDFSAALATLSGQAEDIAVVSWRHGCPYCREIVTPLAPYHARGEVVLLINEDISTVREQGLVGPVLQTVSTDASASILVMGTPAGFPVKSLTVAAGGGVGGGSVLRMLRDRAIVKGTVIPVEDVSGEGGHNHPHDHHVVPDGPEGDAFRQLLADHEGDHEH